MTRVALALLLTSWSLTAADPSRKGPETAGVRLVEQAGKVRIEVNGQLLTEYHFQEGPHLFFFPLVGPGNAEMTRHYPMATREGEERDHPHHRSLWFSHGDVNGHDFWAETAKSGRIV